MSLVIAVGLFVLSVASLTMPLTRRDSTDFSPVEIGYIARGPRGALLAAVRLLKRDGLVEVRPRIDQIERKGSGRPTDEDPLVRTVFAALRRPRSLTGLLDDVGVDRELQATGDRVQQAGMRVGPGRRIAGSAIGLAAPAVALVGVAHDANALVGITVAVVSTFVVVSTLQLHGATVGGRRTFDAVQLRRATSAMPEVRPVGMAGGGTSDTPFAGPGYETSGGHGFDFGGHSGGGDSGGHSGGHG